MAEELQHEKDADDGQEHVHPQHFAFGAHLHCTCGCHDGGHAASSHTVGKHAVGDHCQHEHDHAAAATAIASAVHDEHDHADADDDDACALKKLARAAVLFVAALLIEHLPLFAADGYLSRVYGVQPQLVRAAYILCYLLAYLTCGRSVVLGAARNIARGKVFDEQFLMTVASLGAVCIGEFAEAVAVMLFYMIGEYFQDYAVDRSRASISALMDIRPDQATVLRDGAAVTVAAATVAVGELLEVKHGERIALDGVVESGESFVDTSALTGESVPRRVSAGAEVLAGFVNTQGVLTLRVTKPYGESAVTRILELTEKATAQKATSERFITRFARVYTPIVCVLALCVALLPPLVLQFASPELFARYGWSVWVQRALLFLVVSCPCALVISVPLSFFSGIGAASSCGVLVKGSNYMEALAAVRTAVFDKTGTLTKGVFSVTHIRPRALLTGDELLAVAAHAESYSNHPISKSLKAAHTCPRCASVVCTDVQELSGQGIAVTVDGKRVLAGNAALMTAQQVAGFTAATADKGSAALAATASPLAASATGESAASLLAAGGGEPIGTTVHIAVDGSYCGYIVISDEAKDDAASAISGLQRLGVKQTVMLTGDDARVAARVAAQVGVASVYAELLPQDKVARLEALLAEKRGKVLFVGDGVNDAPVLARADVGVAMGALGSDAAIEAADVVIMDDKPSRLVDAIRVARATVAVVWQNIVFALGVKAAIMALGAIGIANLWVAVFGDVGVAFLCVLNALRLLRLSKKMQR